MGVRLSLCLRPLPQKMEVDNHGADAWEEVLDVVNGSNVIVGQERRDIVHKTGLLHRSVHVFVFNEAGEMLLQRRSPYKSLAPRLWDLSCAEHLSAGESFEDAAKRGLQEELGITEQTSLKLVREAYLHMASYPEKNMFDNEFISTFVMGTYRGAINHDPKEVTETSFWPVEQILRTLRTEPEQFTAWFQAELNHIDLEKIQQLSTVS